MQAAAIFLDRVSAALNRGALWGAMAAVLTMAFAAAYQVVARYMFDAPPVWTEELARRAMVWAGMLGASVAFRERSDPTLFPDMAQMPGSAGTVLALVRAVGVTVFALPVIYYSLFGPNFDFARGFLGRSLDRKAEMLAIPMVWFTAAVPIAFMLIMVHVMAAVTVQVTGNRQSKDTTKDGIPA
jgi:TRAP-type C4-dicarboxylate transport system permease small subunit